MALNGLAISTGNFFATRRGGGRILTPFDSPENWYILCTYASIKIC